MSTASTSSAPPILAGCVAALERGKKRVLVEADTHGSSASHRDSLRKLLSSVPAQQPGFVTKSVDRLGRRLSLIVGEATPQVTLHVLVRPPLMFGCLTSPTLSEILARRACEEIALLWGDDASGSRPSTSTSSAADQPATPVSAEALATLLERHADPERLARLNRIADIQAEAEETAALVSENVAHMLSHADDLEALEDKSTSLLHQSRALQRDATNLRRSSCCREYKLRIVLGVFGTLGAGGAVVLVLQLMGLLKF